MFSLVHENKKKVLSFIEIINLLEFFLSKREKTQEIQSSKNEAMRKYAKKMPNSSQKEKKKTKKYF
jgi:hypothetical protein